MKNNPYSTMLCPEEMARLVEAKEGGNRKKRQQPERNKYAYESRSL